MVQFSRDHPLRCERGTGFQPLPMSPPLHPSQEGNLQPLLPTKLPSWEGPGVGSWTVSMVSEPRRLSMNWLVATPVKAWGRFANLLRPPAHPSSPRYDGAGAGSYGSWAVSRSKWNRRLSMNRPVGADVRRIISSGLKVRASSRRLLRFMAPMRMLELWSSL